LGDDGKQIPVYVYHDDVTGEGDQVRHYGGSYSVTLRFIAGKDADGNARLKNSPYSMDDPESIKRMLSATNNVPESLSRDLKKKTITEEESNITSEPSKAEGLGVNTPATSDLKSLLKKIFDTHGLVHRDYSRSGHQFRADSPIPNNADIEGLKSWFDQLDMNIEEYEPTISEKYDTFVLTTRRIIPAEEQKDTYHMRGSFDDIPAGTQIFYVPLVMKSAEKTGKEQRYILDKALIPDAFGLGGETPWEDASTIAETVKGEIPGKYPTPAYPEWVATELMGLLPPAQKQGAVIRFAQDLQFGPDDLKVVSKDYGEILSALWTMSQASQPAFSLPYAAVSFPADPAQKLVDFYGYTNEGVKIPVSVKSGKVGGKVAITNITDTAKALYETTQGKGGALPQEQQFIEIAKTSERAHESTGKTQPLYIHQILREDPSKPESPQGTKTIKKLAEIMSQNGQPTTWDKITGDMVKKWLETKTDEELIGNRMPEIKDVENKNTGKIQKKYVEPKLVDEEGEAIPGTGILEGLWKQANSWPKMDAYKQNNRDKLLLVCSPMGSQMVSMLNESALIQAELNRLAQTLTVIQANVNARKKVLTFALNKFKEASFVFAWPGYIAGNTLGFLMEIKK